MPVESDNLARVVGHEANFSHTKIIQDLRTHAVVSKVRAEAELFVSLDRVETFLLKFVGFDFVAEPNASSFLPHVYENSASLFLDLP